MITKTVLASAICILGICKATDVAAATIKVNSASQFSQAVKQAKGGDVISLAAGLRLSNVTISGMQYNSMVTIRSASSQLATFQKLKVENVKNLKLTSLNFSSSDTPALVVSNSSNVTIDNNDLLKVYIGIFCQKSTHILITNNDITSSYDGLRFTSDEDVMVDGNRITVTKQSGAHVDGIQVYENSTSPTESITIQNNIVKGNPNHGIYMGNKGAQSNLGKNKAYWYSDVLIQNNEISIGTFAGIAVSYASDVKILKNNLLGGSSKQTIVVETANTNVSILGNKTNATPHAGHVRDAWRTDREIPKSWNTDF